MGEEKLPETWEEFQRERRWAFMAGASWIGTVTHRSDTNSSEASRRRYPIRKKVPRVINDNLSSAQFRAVSMGDYMIVQHKFPAETEWKNSLESMFVTERRARIFADLFANPYEEIEE